MDCTHAQEAKRGRKREEDKKFRSERGRKLNREMDNEIPRRK